MTNINRREFVKLTAFAAGLGSTFLRERAWCNPLGLPIGLAIYMVREDLQKDAAATLKAVARIGYREIEASVFGSAGNAATFRKMLDDNGLKCPSVHLSFDLKDLNKSFDQAHALGCTYVVSSVPRRLVTQVPEFHGTPVERLTAQWKVLSKPYAPGELNRLIETMNQIGTAAKKQGLVFAMHNHTFEFELVDGEPVLYKMIAETAASGVQVELDCGWVIVAGYNPAEVINKFPDRIKMLHVKDFLPFHKGGDRGSLLGTENGHGVIDYKPIFAAVKSKGVQHIYEEQEEPFTRMTALQAAEVDYKYLHALA